MAEVQLKEVYPVPEKIKKMAYISGMDAYKKLWERSIKESEKFWSEVASEYVTWFKKWDKVEDYNFDFRKGDIYVKYFVNGKLNVSYNCLDRQLEKRGNKIAIQWEGNEPGEDRAYTYRQMYEEVCKFANVLKSLGVKKGDRVCFYLPMIPELAIGMLACTRIGAIHSIVFGGFSSDSLRDRIQDSTSKILVTCDGTFRGAKAVPQKTNADDAIKDCPSVEKVIVVRRVGDKIKTDMGAKDLWWHEAMAKQKPECEPEWMDAEDSLFILYTSGSTGKPKGVMHTTGGYLTYCAYSHKMIFDYKENDIYWCTADIGWVTGHSYIVYGPLANGATSVMFEGVPNYPDVSRFWKVVEKYKVNIFYTAPTAIRAIAKEGSEWVKKADTSSLRILGTVGEPINPEAWNWYYNTVGRGECPIVDTWWQTETGGILITPLPGAVPVKPGMATLPFMGVEPLIVNDVDGTEIKETVASGALCIRKPWPGIMRGVYGDPMRFQETYFIQYPGYYFTGDGARRDKDGYYQITGRIDDVINVSGHRMGTAEVESALVAHPKVAEAAVVGYPHDIKGQSIYAYVTVKTGVQKSDDLKKELTAHVRALIGPIATPEKIQFADGLPKTRSGKIMRRILKKVAANDIGDIGDTTTLADPSVVDDIVKNRL